MISHDACRRVEEEVAEIRDTDREHPGQFRVLAHVPCLQGRSKNKKLEVLASGYGIDLLLQVEALWPAGA